jgi:eukaryotic-like serine/threonine-protein kinase
MSSSVFESGATVGGKYRLVRRIGVGGMGEVWVATNRTTGAEVAVKMARGSPVSDDSTTRFRHEARLGATLAHRGIVRIFDLVETDGMLVLVMELLRGATLERYLQRRGPLPRDEAIAIAVPVLSALAHAHETGIVHRDVTPANIFLAVDPDGHVTPKLLDFGIAKVPASGATHTVDGRALGTPRYMAPERIRDQGPIDGRTDLFSVAVVVYEMLTDVCPFGAASPAASLAAVLETVVDPDPRIDPRVWIELRRSLSKQAYERHPTALAMAQGLLTASGQTEASLSDVLREAPVLRDVMSDDALPFQATRTVGGHSLGRASAVVGPRRRILVWVSAGLLSCAGLAVAVSSIRRGEHPRASSPAPIVETPASVSVVDRPQAATLPSASSAPSASTTASGSPVASAWTAPAAVPQAAPRRGHPARPKPVAITPGF